MGESGERRDFSRVPFRVAVTLTSDHATVMCADVRDVSLSGLYAIASARLPPGSLCDVEIVLGGAESEARLRIKGRVARVDIGGLAVQFLEMGFDTFYHLRNLVLYNCGDQGNIEDEFKAHRRTLDRF
jgi:hypothetical protein